MSQIVVTIAPTAPTSASSSRPARGWILAVLSGALLLAGCSKKPKDDRAGEPPPLVQAAEQKPAAQPTQTPAPAPAPAPTEKAAATEKADGGELVAGGEEMQEQGDTEAASDDTADKHEKKKKTASKKKSKTKKCVRARSSSSESVESAKSKTATSKAVTEGDLVLKRIQFASKISEREPVEPEETFSRAEIDKLYAFVELSNKSKQKTKVIVLFIPPQGQATKVTLNVGDKPRWRTWALRKAPKAVGTWKVVVKDESGRELGHRTFEVTE
ncbi:MAG: DUF2914 domain-containing protein [Polyangiaceae bacterium]